MGMYHKDKTEVLKIRVTQEQDEYLMRMAVLWGVSKSQVLRSIIDSYRFRGPDDENK